MANMIFTLPDGVVVNAKSSKVNADTSVQKPAIVQKTEDGKLVKSLRKTDFDEYFNSFSWVDTIEVEVEEFNENGKVIGRHNETRALPKNTIIKDYAINPETGILELVRSFEPTKQVKLSWSMTLPVTYAGRLLQESLYEVYGSTDVDNLALCKLIDEAIEKDVMFVHENFVWRKGYSAYHSVFIPNRDIDGKYSLTMMTTKGKAVYQHKMNPTPIEEEGKEIKVLPSLLNTLIGD